MAETDPCRVYHDLGATLSGIPEVNPSSAFHFHHDHRRSPPLHQTDSSVKENLDGQIVMPSSLPSLKVLRRLDRLSGSCISSASGMPSFQQSGSIDYHFFMLTQNYLLSRHRESID
jgi:hypothetical protein